MTAVAAISQQIWDMKYRLKMLDGQPVDKTVGDTWTRVAKALAEVEANPAEWTGRFAEALSDFQFLPAGRILAGAGTGRTVTLFNCFVMGTIPDDMGGIFANLREAALTMQQGGGIGYDFSTLRPKGAPVQGVGADASGPLSFMDVWDAMCRTIMSAGHRRGAMMATLRCDHPDIEAFIDAKREPGRLRMFNLSVLVTDAFMTGGAPGRRLAAGLQRQRLQDGSGARPVGPHHAGHLCLCRAGRDLHRPDQPAEQPVVLQRIYPRPTHAASSRCRPMAPACSGRSIWRALVRDPFTEHARLDMDRLAELVPVAVRMMDNVVDVSRFPLAEQQAEAKAKRRIGLGVTGLADALILCRARYGSEQAVALTEHWLAAMRRHAYLASTELAAEKGPFPLFDAEKFLAGETMPDARPRCARRHRQARHPQRAADLDRADRHDLAVRRQRLLRASSRSSASLRPHVLMPDGSRRQEEVTDYAYRLFRQKFGEDAPLPDYFVDAQTLTPADHVVMQAAAQNYIDSSISKTINCPADLPFEALQGRLCPGL